ncbi:hypothetical protein U1Q18_018408 [Sarracenia purpurea var. burkii]
MEWAIAELVNHPTVEMKIRHETLAVLGRNPVTESNLPELPCLQATMKETLRLHTPIPLLVPHINLEAKLVGYTIPKESNVVVNAGWLANNPAWWKILMNSVQSGSCKRKEAPRWLQAAGRDHNCTSDSRASNWKTGAQFSNASFPRGGKG